MEEFERQVERIRKEEALATEARVRAESKQREEELLQEIAAMKERFQNEKDGLISRLQERSLEVAIREGERDEARMQVKEFEEKSANGNTESAQARLRALEMEINLIKTRFGREVSAREALQGEVLDLRTKKEKLEAQLSSTIEALRVAERYVAEVNENASFRNEIQHDLEARLMQQQKDSDRRVNREKGKLEAIARLEGVLPRSVILKAVQ
mmetsp:Transcript_94649/g.207127  ORF Transcript_94649/g.207127 Transcript_94649/m.207127 type:complete len:212 (+) Transcript_94649:204-839(+)